MDNSELFIEKYKKLEYAVTKRYKLTKNDSPIVYISKLKAFEKYQKEIDYCREVRNFLQHEAKIDDEFAVIPSQKMIDLIDNLITYVTNPPKCFGIALKKDKIFYRCLDDNVLKSIKELSHKKYTHIPILENGVVIGVFSKTSIFNYLLDNDWKRIDESLTFRDLKKYIELNIFSSEGYLFIKKSATISEVVEIVEECFKKGRRISLVFLTETGKEHEKILGMLTPWDILGY